jgi:F-type H+-transporting ATPase subunit b
VTTARSRIQPALRAAGLGLALLSPVALAEEPATIERLEVPTECPATPGEAADEECEIYWQNHINWFSWDYKAGPEQLPEHRHMPPPFFFALVNFAVFLWIMWRLAARPLSDFVRARHTTIRRDLDEAQALHREAEARLNDYQARIAGLDREIDTLIAQVKADAQVEKERIIAEASAQAARLQKDAEAQIDVELRRMQGELKAEAVGAAIAAAETMIKSQAGADDQRRLAERFAGELERAPAAPGAPTSTTARS